MSAGSEHRTDPGARVVYREALRVPVWWYVVAVGIAAIIAAEFHISSINLIDWIAFGVLLPLSVVIVWSLGRGHLEIRTGGDGELRSGELRVRGAHIPLGDLSGAVALDAATLRRVVGREGDPAAFVSIRPWIGPGVQLWVDDPEDPTPYWVVSSRQPRRIVDLVRSCV
jgi:hypothetical protein